MPELTRFALVKGEVTQLSIALLLLGIGTLAVAAAPSSADSTLVVVFPPWTSQAIAIRRATSAGARLVAIHNAGFIVTVAPDGTDFAATIEAGGPVLILSSRAAAGCSGRIIRS